MAPRFFGRFEHSLDVKGRVVLPARFRVSFDSIAFLTQHLDGCLALWTPDEFTAQMDERLASQGRSSHDRQLVRVWAAGSTDVEIDRQGRVPVPAYLQRFAKLESTVLVIGAIDRIELWNPDEWARRVLPAEADLSDPPAFEAPAAG